MCARLRVVDCRCALFLAKQRAAAASVAAQSNAYPTENQLQMAILEGQEAEQQKIREQQSLSASPAALEASASGEFCSLHCFCQVTLFGSQG